MIECYCALNDEIKVIDLEVRSNLMKMNMRGFSGCMDVEE